MAVPARAASGEGSTYWSDGGETWRGYGEAVRCEGQSLAEAGVRARAELAALTVVCDGDAPAPRMFGGQRFDLDDARHDDDPAWSGTPRALLVLPQWSVVDDGATTWTLAVVPRDVACDAAALAAWFRDAPRGDAVDGAPHGVIDDDPVELRAARWTSLVRASLRAFDEGALRKLVGARRVRARAVTPWATSSVVHRMTARATRFALTLGAARFVGATPERLVVRRGAVVETDALAGSIPRVAGDEARQSAELLRSEKDLREHALVVTAIREALSPWCATLDVPDAPAVKSLPTLLHLWTPMRATLRDPSVDVTALVARLHPTPAVGGTPRALAVPWLRAHEDAPRGWYAGPVGWCDASGDGVFCVALRAAVLRDGWAWLYAGAGLVTGSDPAKEWAETEAKLGPMREALGVA